MKRYLIYPLQFDARVRVFDKIEDHWDLDVKELHHQNRKKVTKSLRSELGDFNFEIKLKNFQDLGHSPFSIVSHHNVLFGQARYAFIHAYYYPALTASAALGERILNHLFLDLRANFPRSEHDRKAHTRKSIDDWSRAIKVLDAWGVFQTPKIRESFEKLREIRNRVLHFNSETVATLREESLAALTCLSNIIEGQFGFQFSNAISGSKGSFFFRKNVENNPFIRHYYISQCPYVTPYYSMRFVNGAWLVFDRDVSPEVEVSDDEFVSTFSARTLEQLVPNDIPPRNGITVVALTLDGVKSVKFQPAGTSEPEEDSQK